jgi:hypothetical protein
MVAIHPERSIYRGQSHGRLTRALYPSVTMLLTNYGIYSIERKHSVQNGHISIQGENHFLLPARVEEG